MQSFYIFFDFIYLWSFIFFIFCLFFCFFFCGQTFFKKKIFFQKKKNKIKTNTTTQRYGPTNKADSLVKWFNSPLNQPKEEIIVVIDPDNWIIKDISPWVQKVEFFSPFFLCVCFFFEVFFFVCFAHFFDTHKHINTTKHKHRQKQILYCQMFCCHSVHVWLCVYVCQKIKKQSNFSIFFFFCFFESL